MADETDRLKRLEERAWQSFALHSAQRLTTFNFYIILASLLVTAMVGTFQREFRVPYLGAAVGVALAIVSFLFWKMDIRNRELVKLAETALKHFEASVSSQDAPERFHPAAFFLREEYETAPKKAGSTWIWRRHYSYANILNRIYFLFGAVGVTGAVMSVWSAP